MHEPAPRLWAIILAGGEGRRLASLTRALYGGDLPKQFAVLAQDRSMLQATVDRALQMTAEERVVVVVAREREALARRQLRHWPGIDLLVQPRNLDTGPGLLLPLARVRARDPAARVVVLPADHYFAVTEPLIDAVELAAGATRQDRLACTLLGATADSPDPEYGWILPGRRLGRCARQSVKRFVEKPAAPEAERLLRRGGLWNTFIMVALVERLWRLASAGLPEHAGAIATATAVGEGALDAAYAGLGPANFSRAVLEPSRGLGVLPLQGAGWSDWGTPRRVFKSLAGTASHDRLLARIGAPLVADRSAARSVRQLDSN
jgi:mannose-1-phosphate guanylyltransferase